MMKLTRCKLALTNLLLLTIPPAIAAPQLEEVIVTAQKRAESAQDVPISVTAMSAESLARNGLTNLESMSEMIPNLNMGSSPDDKKIVMRGIGSGTGTPSFEQSVGLYIDGIYAGRAAQFQVPFLDVASVEVVRGPQGVLFGKNSVAGAISIITQKPGDEFGGYVNAGYNSFSQHDVTTVINLPLTDKLGARFIAKKQTTGGYLENPVQDTDGMNADNEVFRLSFKWDLSDHISIFFKAEHADQNDESSNLQLVDYDADAPASAPTGSAAPPIALDLIAETIYAQQDAAGEDYTANETTYSNKADGRRLISDSYTFKLTGMVGEHELTWLSGYSEYEKKNDTDADFSASNFVQLYSDEFFEQTSHELRIASPVGGTFEYVAGLFYVDRWFYQPNWRFDFDLLLLPGLQVSVNSLYEEPTESKSAFFQGTWNINEQLSFTAGIRRTFEEKLGRASQIITRYGSNDDQSDNLVIVEGLTRTTMASLLGYEAYTLPFQTSKEANTDYTVNLQWTPSDNTMFYYTHARATKAGGFDAADITGNPDEFGFRPETATSHEIGGKLELFDRRLRANTAIFRTQFDDLQVANFNGSELITDNAEGAVTQGVEIELTFVATESLLIGGNIARLDATYLDFPDAPCPGNQGDWNAECEARNGGGRDGTGDTLDQAPEWSGSVYLSYSHLFSDTFFVSSRLDIIYSDDVALDASLQPSTIQEAYTKYNASVRVSSVDEKWFITLAGYNLSDETTLNFASPGVLATRQTIGNLAPPRTFALSGQWNFGAF
ncbi:Pesticin receptor [Zhongshania aliphaticivorans]|uniref:Pesticin receptor n=1 Tax=Zhongshania aliphaticivorans TaxID=1470434 RepID=A0A5S9Q0H6_9GAMM|nr:TonB-dependent receptor [Zhongshania aliphaticivorans]CAA0093094.1 Pesticin receptor [Zhongshania aliphaticivorans]CAA0110853.1 Pesticin receptor [Zhongshania aliphaticivorans]